MTKLSKREENTVGKGEIARHEQFLLFPQHFQKYGLPKASKGVIVWEWVNDTIYLKIPPTAYHFTPDLERRKLPCFCHFSNCC